MPPGKTGFSLGISKLLGELAPASVPTSTEKKTSSTNPAVQDTEDAPKSPVVSISIKGRASSEAPQAVRAAAPATKSGEGAQVLAAEKTESDKKPISESPSTNLLTKAMDAISPPKKVSPPKKGAVKASYERPAHRKSSGQASTSGAQGVSAPPGPPIDQPVDEVEAGPSPSDLNEVPMSRRTSTSKEASFGDQRNGSHSSRKRSRSPVAHHEAKRRLGLPRSPISSRRSSMDSERHGKYPSDVVSWESHHAGNPSSHFDDRRRDGRRPVDVVEDDRRRENYRSDRSPRPPPDYGHSEDAIFRKRHSHERRPYEDPHSSDDRHHSVRYGRPDDRAFGDEGERMAKKPRLSYNAEESNSDRPYTEPRRGRSPTPMDEDDEPGMISSVPSSRRPSQMTLPLPSAARPVTPSPPPPPPPLHPSLPSKPAAATPKPSKEDGELSSNDGDSLVVEDVRSEDQPARSQDTTWEQKAPLQTAPHIPGSGWNAEDQDQSPRNRPDSFRSYPGGPMPPWQQQQEALPHRPPPNFHNQRPPPPSHPSTRAIQQSPWESAPNQTAFSVNKTAFIRPIDLKRSAPVSHLQQQAHQWQEAASQAMPAKKPAVSNDTYPPEMLPKPPSIFNFCPTEKMFTPLECLRTNIAGSMDWATIDVSNKEAKAAADRRRRDGLRAFATRMNAIVGCSPLKLTYKLADKVGEGTFGIVNKATIVSMDGMPEIDREDSQNDMTGLRTIKHTYGGASVRRKGTPGQVVAVKKIILHQASDGMPITSLREIRLLKLLDHPNVVPVLDIAYEEGDPNTLTRGNIYMVFPYMDHDLAGILDQPTIRLKVSQIKLYAQQLLEGTRYLHKHQILHRDMKTANLLIDNKGCLMIADFGLARSLHSRRDDKPGPQYTNMVVTRWYRPPELLLGERRYTFAVDMWGVACVIAEMFTRAPLFRGESEVDQCKRIFELCGNPTSETMPGWENLPGCEGVVSWESHNRKVNYKFSAHHCLGLPQFLDALLRLNPNERLTAKDALNHDWFWTAPLPMDPKEIEVMPSSHEYDKRKREVRQMHQQQQAAQAAAQLRNRQPQALPNNRKPLASNIKQAGAARRTGSDIGLKFSSRKAASGAPPVPAGPAPSGNAGGRATGTPTVRRPNAPMPAARSPYEASSTPSGMAFTNRQGPSAQTRQPTQRPPAEGQDTPKLDY